MCYIIYMTANTQISKISWRLKTYHAAFSPIMQFLSTYFGGTFWYQGEGVGGGTPHGQKMTALKQGQKMTNLKQGHKMSDLKRTKTDRNKPKHSVIISSVVSPRLWRWQGCGRGSP